MQNSIETLSKRDNLKHTFSSEEIVALNQKYRRLTPENRLKEVYRDFELEEIILTTSFAATSALLLNLVSEANKSQLIYFIDTGYHFNETHIYKDYLIKLYDLNVVEQRADEQLHSFTTKERTWEKDPDLCCSVNKVQPLQSIVGHYNIWISGLMSWQSDHRESLDIFEERGSILKFYPLLDITKEERHDFIASHHLPFHPLVSKGYESIGCSHCTKPGADRDGRWNNSPKTECGLHL
jgi:phosphoadenosine phosphosulfate reductase